MKNKNQKESVFHKNLTLGMEFSRYVMEHPTFAAKIPQNAQIVLLPEYDKKLCQTNLKLADEQREEGQPRVYVHIKKLKPVSSRLVRPRLVLQDS